MIPNLTAMSENNKESEQRDKSANMIKIIKKAHKKSQQFIKLTLSVSISLY